MDEDFDVPFDRLQSRPELLHILARLELDVDAVDVVLDLIAIERVVDVVICMTRRWCALAGHVDVAALNRAYHEAKASTCDNEIGGACQCQGWKLPEAARRRLSWRRLHLASHTVVIKRVSFKSKSCSSRIWQNILIVFAPLALALDLNNYHGLTTINALKLAEE